MLKEEFPILEFLAQEDYNEGFITGPGGSGKTEQLIKIVDTLNTHKIEYLVVAFTNKAVEVIKNRVPTANVSTLHSWLKKRPGINSNAKNLNALVVSSQFGEPRPIQVLIVDEFSMIGDKDYYSIGELIDPNLNGEVHMHTLYIGDLSQLSPVKGFCMISPNGDYWLNLTHIYRTTNDLQIPLQELRDAIDGNYTPELSSNNNLHLVSDVAKEYTKCNSNSKVLLAYTNKKVQELNATVQGRDKPIVGDIIFDQVTKVNRTIVNLIDRKDVVYLDTPRKGEVIDVNTKYNPLKTLLELPYLDFYELDNGKIVAAIFGVYKAKTVKDHLGKVLVDKNAKGEDSKLAYKMYKTVSDYTFTFDFTHCITTHKTQGSEWDYAFIDTEDYNICFNQTEKLKLLYVGMSRARKDCYVNTLSFSN
jgi:ATP-dependent exoDNAse (exonuclease V) alpha subunit